MTRRPPTALAWAAALALTVAGCGRAEDETLDAERQETTASPSGSPASAASASPVAESTTVVGEAGFPLTMRVPAAWDQTSLTAWTVGAGEDAKVGQRLTAHASGDPAPKSAYPVGANLATSQTFLNYFDIPTESFAKFAPKWAQFVAGFDYADDDPSCEYGGVSDVSGEGSFALHRIWTACGEGTVTIADVWSANPDTGEVIFASAVVEGGDDVEAARSVLGSIAREDGELVFDVDG
jgi:hypothetical protein